MQKHSCLKSPHSFLFLLYALRLSLRNRLWLTGLVKHFQSTNQSNSWFNAKTFRPAATIVFSICKKKLPSVHLVMHEGTRQWQVIQGRPMHQLNDAIVYAMLQVRFNVFWSFPIQYLYSIVAI